MKFRKEIEDFGEYEPKSGGAKIRMDKNECPFPLPTELKRELNRRLRDVELNRYPHVHADPLREKIARSIGFRKENVIVGNGSDELFPYLFKLFPGEKIITNPPTFSMYRFYGSQEGLKIKKIPLKKDFSLSLNEIKRNLDRARAMIICSPNNPTGNLQPREDILELLETGGPMILDEAYHEFSPTSNLDLIGEYDNLIILRTFSKACGLAGARIGYAVASPKVIRNLLKIKSPFNVNTLSKEAAKTILDHPDLINERVKNIKEERNKIEETFPGICLPSNTNFLLMDVDARDKLLEDGIAVRGFHGELEKYIRVTVGRKKENKEFIDSLKDFLNDHKR